MRDKWMSKSTQNRMHHPLASGLVWFAALASLSWLLSACASDHHAFGPDSETHFLSSCSSNRECGAGSCVCGVCTKSCEQASECAAAGPMVICTRPSDDSCDSKRVCDVLCVDDEDCRPLGSGHRCDSGRCRAGSSPRRDAGQDAGVTQTATGALDAGMS